MSADADHWWRNRREASAKPGDAWSGGGEAYRRWVGAKSAGPAPASVEQVAEARTAKRERRSAPRAPRFMRPRAPRGAARPFRSAAEVLLSVLTGMPSAWVGIAGLAAVVLLVPLAWAGRLDPCAAAEVALVDEAVGRGSRFEGSKRRVANWVGPDGELFSHGRVGRQIAAEEHVGWPPPVGCTALFWRVRADGASFGGFTFSLLRRASARR